MTHIEDSIIIKGELEDIYNLAQQVERYPEFIPGYLESRIVEFRDGKPVIKRVTLVNGKPLGWRSIASFQKNGLIEFEQIEGRLKGMRAKWIFEEVPEGTKVVITHDFKLNLPVIGWFMEILVAKPAVSRVAQTVLEALKRKIESGK